MCSDAHERALCAYGRKRVSIDTCADAKHAEMGGINVHKKIVRLAEGCDQTAESLSLQI